MNPTPPNKNRLKDAVNSVPVPDDLAARLRSQIHAQGLPSGARDRLKSAVKNVPVPASLDSRIRNPISGALPPWRWLPRLAPVFVAAGVLAALWTAYQFGHLRLTKRLAGRLHCFCLFPPRRSYAHRTERSHPLLGVPQVSQESSDGRRNPQSKIRKRRQADIATICRADSDCPQPCAREISNDAGASVHL